MNIISISDFRNNISDYINRVLYKNESFLLKKGGSIVAKVTVYEDESKATIEDKVKKFSGSLNNKEATKIKKNMQDFRQSFKLFSK